jgi:hypothetical protein
MCAHMYESHRVLNYRIVGGDLHFGIQSEIMDKDSTTVMQICPLLVCRSHRRCWYGMVRYGCGG